MDELWSVPLHRTWCVAASSGSARADAPTSAVRTCDGDGVPHAAARAYSVACATSLGLASSRPCADRCGRSDGMARRLCVDRPNRGRCGRTPSESSARPAASTARQVSPGRTNPCAATEWARQARLGPEAGCDCAHRCCWALPLHALERPVAVGQRQPAAWPMQSGAGAGAGADARRRRGSRAAAASERRSPAAARAGLGLAAVPSFAGARRCGG